MREASLVIGWTLSLATLFAAAAIAGEGAGARDVEVVRPGYTLQAERQGEGAVR